MNDEKPFTSRVAPIWDFEKTHPDAPAEERLKACLMRESISKPYVEAALKERDRLKTVIANVEAALADQCSCSEHNGIKYFCGAHVVLMKWKGTWD